LDDTGFTHIWALQKSVSHGQTEIVVDAAFDQGNHVDGLEDVEHHTCDG
jgi:hypothetical protein